MFAVLKNLCTQRHARKFSRSGICCDSRFSQFSIFQFSGHLGSHFISIENERGQQVTITTEKWDEKWLNRILKVHNDDTLLGPRAYFNPIALEVKLQFSLSYFVKIQHNKKFDDMNAIFRMRNFRVSPRYKMLTSSRTSRKSKPAKYGCCKSINHI